MLSSFSKNGYHGIELDGIEKKIVFVYGDGISEHLTVREIMKRLAENNALVCAYASPLSSDIIDAAECEDCIFIASHGYKQSGGDTLDLSKNESYSAIKRAYDTMLLTAQNAFKEASEYHFALEDIYSRNIDFESNSDKLSHILNAVGEVFS